jgi:hypothetical protein
VFSCSVSFLENAVLDMIDGATLVESLIGDVVVGDNAVVFGDLLFHYSVLLFVLVDIMEGFWIIVMYMMIS